MQRKQYVLHTHAISLKVQGVILLMLHMPLKYI